MRWIAAVLLCGMMAGAKKADPRMMVCADGVCLQFQKWIYSDGTISLPGYLINQTGRDLRGPIIEFRVYERGAICGTMTALAGGVTVPAGERWRFNATMSPHCSGNLLVDAVTVSALNLRRTNIEMDPLCWGRCR
jgi:hypothetical protein